MSTQSYSTRKLLQGLLWELAAATPKIILATVMKFTAYVGLGKFTTDKRCITPSYLTNQLRRHGLLTNAARVTRIRWTAIERGAVAVVYRINIEYDNPHEAATSKAPSSAIVKVLGDDFRTLVIGSIVAVYKQERRCITTFRELYAKDLMPRIYAVEMPWCGLGFYIMEDYGKLRHRRSRDGGMSLEEVCKMAAFSGTLHARTFLNTNVANNMTIFSPWLFHTVPELFKKVQKCNCFGPILRDKCPRLLGLMKEIANNPADFFAVHNYNMMRVSSIDQLPDFSVSLPEDFTGCDRNGRMNFVPFTVIHGDARLDNTFFDMAKMKGEGDPGEVRMIDWQICAPRAPMSEIMWMLVDTDPAISCDREKLNAVFNAYLDQFFKNCEHHLVVSGPLGDRAILKKLLFEVPFVSSLYYYVLLLMIGAGAIISEENHDVRDGVEKTFSRLEALCNAYLPR